MPKYTKHLRLVFNFDGVIVLYNFEELISFQLENKKYNGYIRKFPFINDNNWNLRIY